VVPDRSEEKAGRGRGMGDGGGRARLSPRWISERRQTAEARAPAGFANKVS